MNLWASIYRHHRWSNQRMLEFLAGLTDEQLALTVPGTYGSSIATIRHVISADADYVRIIPDTPEVTQIAEDGSFGGWDELRKIAWEADSALMDYVDGLTEDAFFVDIDDGTAFDLTKSFLLGQIIHHATEHRSQIRTTLSTHGITPPEIDVWAWRKSEDGQELLNAVRALGHGRTEDSEGENSVLPS